MSTGKVFDDFEIAHAASIIESARADLGDDLGGFSVYDLLLDNLPNLASVADAKRLAELAMVQA